MMRLLFITVLLLTACISLSGAESGAQISSAATNAEAKTRYLKGSNKQTEEESWLASVEEERGISWTSANKFISRLKARINAKNLAGVKTETLTKSQVKTVSREVAKEVNKNPKTWPIIKKGLKVLYGTLLFSLIIAGVYAMVHSMRNYT